MATKAFIYVLTNEAFSGQGHDWVKIGYATDVERRRRELSTTAVPYPYEIYATYEIPAESRIADKVLHRLITQLNPALRLVKNREFFEMSPEAAYDLLHALAVIHNCEEKLVRYHHGKPILPPPNEQTNKPDKNAEDQAHASALLPLLKDFHELFYVDTPAGRATMSVDTGYFVVKAGSKVRLRDDPHNPDLEIHNTDLSNGTLLKEGEYAVLTKDKKFTSPSYAAAYVKGRSSSGWREWKGPNGQNMDFNVQRK